MARGLRLRHDHGSNYLADDFQQEVAFFGIESSPSFVREPEGNGVAERFIRTLKENLLWVRSFDTIEELRLALLASSERTTSSGCWRNTTIEVPLRCDVTSSGWTRQRRCEYRQTTVQEPWALHNKTICDLAIRALDLEYMREKRRIQWKETMVDGEP